MQKSIAAIFTKKQQQQKNNTWSQIIDLKTNF